MTNEHDDVAVKIRWAEMDAHGHMRHSAYADWATEVLRLSMRLAAASQDGSRYVHEVTFRRAEAVVARYRMTGAWFDVQSRRIVPPPAAIAEGCARLTRAEPLAVLPEHPR